ncbi:MAG: GGDEF domain-containing protein [Lachnospiraceae bacterium]|nr:GGDEF domain-containing protein [Lachnospiraceae bacterium]
MNKDKQTIALLLSGLDDSYNEAICKGVDIACREKSFNLVVLPGSYLEREITEKSEKPYAYQFNTIYSYVNESNISGLIIAAGSIGAYSNEKTMLEFLNQFYDVPKVLVSSSYEGFTCVNYDNTNGVREGLEYLIETGGCRKFGMLKGPSGNTDCVQRYNTFMEVMQKHNIEITKDNICEVGLSDDNHEVCKNFLKKNKDIEALFCVNDYSALDLCDEIKKAGKTPGDEIKVLGYDNTVQGAKADPPLATVSADPVVLGYEALEFLEQKMLGKQVNSIDLPATLVIRDSMGVNSNEFASLDGTKNLGDMGIDEAFSYIFYRYRGTGIATKETTVYKSFTKLIKNLKSLMDMDEIDNDLAEWIEKSLNEFLETPATKFADIDHLIMYIEQMQMDALEGMDMESQLNLEYIYKDIYKNILKAIDGDILDNEEFHKKEEEAMKSFVHKTGNIHRGNDYSYGHLLSYLDWLDIKNGYLYIFEEPVYREIADKFEPADEFMIKAFIQDGSLWRIPARHQNVAAYRIFNNDFIDGNRNSMVILPLFVDHFVYGFVILDLTDKIFPNCEFISHQLSAAARIIYYLKMTARMKDELNEKTHEVEPAQDESSGIWNRIGFIKKSTELLEKNKTIGKDTVVALIDVNNLSQINDIFGHDEGDYALKLVEKDIIEKLIEPYIVGKIEDGEYGFVTTLVDGMDEDDLIAAIKEDLDTHNSTSDKPYNVTVSIGKTLFKSDSIRTLSECLEETDTELYIAKQYKPIRAAKAVGRK